MARWWVGLVLLGAPALALADAAPSGPSATDLADAHALAMGGAQRASGLSNATIMLNPAGLFAAQRYNVSLQGEHDLNGALDSFGVQLADSTTGPLAAGVAADRIFLGQGPRSTANIFQLALAATVSDFVFIGASGKLLHTRDGDLTHNRVTPDVGLLLKADPVTIGFTAYNLVDVGSALAPRQYGGGLGVALPHSLKVEGDAVFDTVTRADTAIKLEAGAEWEALPILELRGGYVEDRILDQRAVCAGFGVVVPPGFGLDVGYRHELLGVLPGRVLMATIVLAI